MSGPRPLKELAARTQARVALGRSGSVVPTKAALSFALDHARAREAVWSALDVDRLAAELNQPIETVASGARSRAEYLQRPDLGRYLAPDTDLAAGPGDVAIIVADGLSATAVQMNAARVVTGLVAVLPDLGLSLNRVVLATQARVAIGDDIARTVGAKVAVLLIGERPGLSAADSLGAYVTWDPQADTPNANRNCISNIRDQGLPPDAAAGKIAALLRAMITLGQSGVALTQAMARSDALPKA